MKRIVLCLSMIAVCMSLTACNTTNTGIDDTIEVTKQPIPEQSTILPDKQEDMVIYFQSDEIVNDFFKKYNSITDNPISQEYISSGNIRTKALVYIDDFNMEVINTNRGQLSISIGTSPENEDTKLFQVYADCIKVNMPQITEEAISNAWNDIHATGYLVEDYHLEDINITYVPYKELSQGHSNLRIDLMFNIGQ